MSGFKSVMKTTGSSLAAAGIVTGKGIGIAVKFIGTQAADLYGKIDPDVKRHIAQTPLLSYSLFVSRKSEIEAQEPDGHPPLIFVHGLGGNRGNFLLMSWFLWLSGRKRTYKIHFDGGQSMDEMAQALAAFISDVISVTGEPKVEIVAHSMGGLISRLAIMDHNLEDCVKTLITLGTPHHGTYPARYADTRIIRQLRPDSPLVQKLNSRPWPSQIRGVTMWSKNDVFVLPPESAALDGTEKVETTPFTHYSYLLDPRAFNAVKYALDGHSLDGYVLDEKALSQQIG